MSASRSDGEQSGNVSPLTRDRLPELMEITDTQALGYVSQLLQQLISLHETWSAAPQPQQQEQQQEDQQQRGRAPSFDRAIAKSEDAVQRLVPHRNLTVSADEADPVSHDAPAVEPAIEFENAVELYKRFWLKEVPPISISEYLQRFHRYCRSSAATYLTAGRLIYLLAVDRRIIPVTQRNVYRLFCAAFMVAVKFIEDTMYPMSRYATTAGLKKSDLARLEITLLLLADFDVKVDRETLKSGLKAWAELNATCQNYKNQSSATPPPTTTPIPAV